jgi:4-amino-4-deoxy-L-arabinose transferase-like glycosyltransferase
MQTVAGERTTMTYRQGLLITLVTSTLALAAGFGTAPFWDEDETRFVAIAQTMLDTGDWVVPIYNGTLAVDKPVLMHWSIASAFALFGRSEIAARIPAALATLLTALAVFHAGSRWFSPLAGVFAAMAYVGSLLVAIEGHAATPDAILVACLTWVTVLAAEGLAPMLRSNGELEPHPASNLELQRMPLRHALAVGGITGLAVLCKGPVGFVGPLAVVFLWAWWADADAHLLRRGVATSLGGIATGLVQGGFRTAWRMRPIVLTVAMLAVAAPWYLAVSVRTSGAWPEGFFFVHNLHRFAAPMENHVGGVLYHPLTMLAGFFPWSCWLPLAMVLAGWRIWSRSLPGTTRAATMLSMAWLLIWVATFSAAATKLPNYVLPAYPAAALIVGSLAAEVCRREAWVSPRWFATGGVSLGLGGGILAAIVFAAVPFGLTNGEPVALLGIIPVIAAVLVLGPFRHRQQAAVTTVAITGLVLTVLAVGPAATHLGKANLLPSLVNTARDHSDGEVTLAGYHQTSPAIVCYAQSVVGQWTTPEECSVFWQQHPEGHLLVAEDKFAEIQNSLPAHIGVIDQARPLFRDQDVLLLGPQQPTHTADLSTSNTSESFRR